MRKRAKTCPLCFYHCALEEKKKIYEPGLYSLTLRTSRIRSTCSPFCPPASGRSNIHRDSNSSPHPHRCSYLPCLCAWCCWPPSESPGVFYVSPGDRTPCVVVDCDGEDLRKSRFAVLLRRPSFSSLLVDAWAAIAFKSPLFPIFILFTQRNRADESLEKTKAL